jgi:hypothetical protein
VQRPHRDGDDARPIRQWLTEAGNLITARVDELAATGVRHRPPWMLSLGQPPETPNPNANGSWVPLHAWHVFAAEGFTDFAARPRRLCWFLRAYGWQATAAELLEVVRARVQAHADGIRDLAAAGDEVFGRLLRQGVADDLDQALAELGSFPQ